MSRIGGCHYSHPIYGLHRQSFLVVDLPQENKKPAPIVSNFKKAHLTWSDRGEDVEKEHLKGLIFASIEDCQQLFDDIFKGASRVTKTVLIRSEWMYL